MAILSVIGVTVSISFCVSSLLLPTAQPCGFRCLPPTVQRHRKRKTEEDEQKKKRERRDWRVEREERRAQTDSNCLCFLCLSVWGCLNQSLRSCPLEIRPNEKSAKERKERDGWKMPTGGGRWKDEKIFWISVTFFFFFSETQESKLRLLVSAVVLPTENSLPVSPVDHLSTSRLISCCPPTSPLPSNRRQHIWVTGLSFFFFFLFLRSLLILSVFLLLYVLPPFLPFPLVPFLSSQAWYETSPLQLPQLKLSTTVQAS